MYRSRRLIALSLAAAGLLTLSFAYAQSPDSRNTSRHVRAPYTGRVAIGGFCPVSITDGDELVRGDYRVAARFRGRTYLFPNQRLKSIFAADPVRYVTEVDRKYDHLANGVNLNGYCPVCVVDGQRLVFGRGFFSSSYEGKTYHFASEFQKRRFDKNPERYHSYSLERYHAILETKGYAATTTVWPEPVTRGNRPNWAATKPIPRAGTFKPDEGRKEPFMKGFLGMEGSGAHKEGGYPEGSAPHSTGPTADDVEAGKPFEGSIR